MNIRPIAIALLLAACAAAQDSPTRGVHGLPDGVVKALEGDEQSYCEQWLGEYRDTCSARFRQNLWWRELTISISGRHAFLVENRNIGACGSAGCSLSLFVESSEQYEQILAGPNGEVGSIELLKVLNTVTRAHYDLQKTWADGTTTTLYKWNGKRYKPTK